LCRRGESTKQGLDWHSHFGRNFHGETLGLEFGDCGLQFGVIRRGEVCDRSHLGRGRPKPLLHLVMAHQSCLLEYRPAARKHDEVWNALHSKARG
jgi:hypothetical protein